jgi:hypothetical protein
MSVQTSPLFQVRGSERIDHKRCELKWYWNWKRGLTPRAKTFGALDLGTWVHETLAAWYVTPKRKPGQLVAIMETVIANAFRMAEAEGAPTEVLEGATELAALAVGMMAHYGKAYGRDPAIDVVGVEIPLTFWYPVDNVPGFPPDEIVQVAHWLKPDGLIRLKGREGFYLLETKTAATIRHQHIAIDDQARPYMAMAEHCLKRDGIIAKREKVVGILYNWLRKAVPPDKPANAEGLYLNKDGSVSARQPPPFFKREPFTMSRRAKIQVLERVHREVIRMTRMTAALRENPPGWQALNKTPHYSCPKYCDYFAMCSLHDEGADIGAMQRSMFITRNPYLYADTTTDEHASFEMG